MPSERDRAKAALDRRIRELLAEHFSDVEVRIRADDLYDVVGHGTFDAQPGVGYAVLAANSKHRDAGKQWSVSTPGRLVEALNEVLGWVGTRD